VDTPHKFLLQQQLNRRVILGNVASLLSSSVLSQGMTALALLLTARQLGVDGYGQYAGSFVLTSFAAIAFNLGMDIWLLREGGRDVGRLGELLGTVLAIKGTVGLVWLSAFIVLAPLLGSVQVLHLSSFPANLVRLSALAVWLDSLCATVIVAYKASLRNEMTLILEAGSDGIWLLATLGLIGLGVRRADVYLRVRVIVLLISFVLSVLLAWRRMGLKATAQTTKRVLSQVFPFASSELLAWMYMRIDVLIVALTLGERAVGLYSPSVGIVNALFLVPATVYTVIVPILSNQFVSDVRRAWVTAGRGLLLLLAIGMGVSLIIVLGARPLASLLGASFGGSKEVLQILGVVLVFHSLAYGMAAVLVAAGRQRQRVVAQAVAVSVNVLLNLLVVRWLGIRGVAIVYVITEIVLLSGYAVLVRRYRRITSASALVAEGVLGESDGGG